LGFLGIAMFFNHVQFNDFLTIGTHSSMWVMWVEVT
jgi:hypothetical protein